MCPLSFTAAVESKWVWSDNTTIIHCRPTYGTIRKSHKALTVTIHQEDNKIKATNSLSSTSRWLKKYKGHLILHNPPPPFHWTAIPLRSLRSRIFSKIIPNCRGSVDSHTIWGLDASTTLLLRFSYAPATIPLRQWRSGCAYGDVAATLLRPWRWSYAFVALLYPFYIESEIPIRLFYDQGAFTAILLRFYCALAVSATIHVILTKISNRSGIAVQWNVGLTNQGPNTGKIVKLLTIHAYDDV